MDNKPTDNLAKHPNHDSIVSHLNKILTYAVHSKASDIHLKVGVPPTLRINGGLIPMEGHPVLTAEAMTSLAMVIPDKARHGFMKKGDADFAYVIPSLCRFRGNVYTQRGTPGLVFRVIPKLNFNFEDIGLPKVIREIAKEERGLILVTGVTGSGKSTTLASIIDLINSNHTKNIITLEDPIEFLHQDKKSLIVQREVGSDTESFQEGLKRSLRQDPDVILVGEMRDFDTVETAIHAAETGHLVLSTLHTMDAVETINRIIAMFPNEQHQQIRIQLSSVLKAVISQRLVLKADGKNRVPAVEVLINTAAIKDCIVDPTKTDLIEDFIKQGSSVYQTQTFDQSLYKLVTAGIVSEEEAMKWVKRKDDFKLMLKGVSGTNAWE